MTYSAEVEHMCPLAQGSYHESSPIPAEGKWVRAKEIKDISGTYPRRRLVRPAAGRLQAHPQREGGRHRGGSRRDYRLLGDDPLRSHGGRGPDRQDHPRGAQYGPGLRRDQHGNARALPPDRLRPLRRRPSPRAASPSEPASRTWARGSGARSAPCIPPRPKARDTSR